MASNNSVAADIVENLSIMLTIALIGALILVGGYMIGSATAHNNRVESDRQIECIEHGGRMEYISNAGLICKK